MTGFRAPFERSDGSCRVFAGEPASLFLRLLDADGNEQDYSGRTFRFSVVDHLGRVQAFTENGTPETVVSGSDTLTVIDLTISAVETDAMLVGQRAVMTFHGILAEIIDDTPFVFFRSPFVVERGVNGETPSEGSGDAGYGTVFAVTQPGMVFAISFLGARGPRGIGADDAVVGPSSAVDSNVVLFDGTTGLLVKDSGKAAPAGAFVGTTDVQTLTNKTLVTPLGIVKGDVGLGNVDNTADAAKPVSTAQQTAFDLKANIASPTLTGVPAAPTAAPGTSTTQLATTGFVADAVATAGGAFQPLDADLSQIASSITAAGHALLDDANAAAQRTTLGLGNVDNTSDANKPVSTAAQAALDAKQPLDADLTTIAATITAAGHAILDDANAAAQRVTLVLGNVDNTSDANKPVSTATQTALNLKANLASPALTGTPTAPTAAEGTDTTQIATTAYVTNAVGDVFGTFDGIQIRGWIDCSDAPNYPAGNAGYAYIVSVAGQIGGTAGPLVDLHDILVCMVDGAVAGAYGVVGASWLVIPHKIQGLVSGPLLTINGNLVSWDGADGRTLGDAGLSVADIARNTGETFTGDVVISNTGGSDFWLNTPEVDESRILFTTAGLARFILKKNDDAEAGSNAGSNFQLQAFADDGTILGKVFEVTRATRYATFTGRVKIADGIDVGDADTTLTRDGAGDIQVEGQRIFREGGVDIPIADGGTGASTALAARGNLGSTVVGDALFTAVSAAAAKTTLGVGATGDALFGAGTPGGARTILGTGTADSPEFAAINVGNASDTTITRTGAGAIAVEGQAVLTAATGQPLDATLTALAALSAGAGVLVQTAADTFTKRNVVGTAGQITVADGDGVAGAPTVSLPADVLIPAVLTVPNTGLHLLDTNASHDLVVAPGSNLTADRTLTITTGDADRTLDISATSVTISAAAATVLDDAAVSDMRTTLGAAGLTVANTFSANQTIASGTGSIFSEAATGQTTWGRTGGSAVNNVINGEGTTGFALQRYSADVTSPTVTIAKARGTIASAAAIATNDEFGEILFRGYGASANRSGARIHGVCRETTPSNTAMGGELVFSTSAIGSTTPTARVTILSTGTVRFEQPIRMKGYTVAGLPAGTEGDRAYVTDALAPTFLTALVGGGAVKCPAFYNGAAWVAG